MVIRNGDQVTGRDGNVDKATGMDGNGETVEDGEPIAALNGRTEEDGVVITDVDQE